MRSTLVSSLDLDAHLSVPLPHRQALHNQPDLSDYEEACGDLMRLSLDTRPTRPAPPSDEVPSPPLPPIPFTGTSVANEVFNTEGALFSRTQLVCEEDAHLVAQSEEISSSHRTTLHRSQ